MTFVHLHSHSPFSFLDGGSSIEALVSKTAQLEMPALAVTDHNNLCTAVRFSQAASIAGIKPIQGCEITLENGAHLTLLARNARGYSSICSLLTQAHLSQPRGEPQIAYDNLAGLQDTIVLSGCRRGALSSLITQEKFQEAEQQARAYKNLFGTENFYIEVHNNLVPGTHRLNYYLLQLADSLGIEPVATNNVHYANHEDFIIHDLLTCVRTLTKIRDIHPERPFNGESYLKSSVQMQALFRFYPRALGNTLRIAAECEPVFKNKALHFPEFTLSNGAPAIHLRRLTFEGARRRYGRINMQVKDRLEHELGVIEKMGFAGYFLAVHDLVRYARKEGIRYAGRGSAADSLVAYCLYITEVDSLERNLLFERFINPGRIEMPDIDIDFEPGTGTG